MSDKETIVQHCFFGFASFFSYKLIIRFVDLYGTLLKSMRDPTNLMFD
jgi:hypothetical protein